MSDKIQFEPMDKNQQYWFDLWNAGDERRERYVWRSVKEHGLPGSEYNGKWIQLLKTIDLPRHKEPIFFQLVWTDIDDPAEYTLRRIYTHWREIEFPTSDAD